MKKIARILICLLMTLYIVTSFGAGVFDYKVFEGYSGYSYDEASKKWELKQTVFIANEDAPLSADFLYMTFDGEVGKPIYMPPSMMVRNSGETNGKLQTVAIAVSQEKAYNITMADGSEISLISFTESCSEMISDMASADAIVVATGYDNGNEHSFIISGDDYKPIKEYCALLIRANALSATDAGMASFIEQKYSIATVTKQGDVYTSSNKAKALSDGKAYLMQYYCSYDGLVQYLQNTLSYSFEDAQYAADNCGANWNDEALGTAKSMLKSSNYSYDQLIKSLQRKGFTYEQSVYAADNCGGNWSNAAIQEAKDKLKYSNYSYDGLIKSLQYAGYTYDEAKAAVDQCGADWMLQAAKEAKDKLKYSYYSYDGMIKSLQYAGFTYEEAKHGADLCGADWKAQALGEAKDKLKYSHYSYDGLVKSLEYAGFSHEEATYGADGCGANWKDEAVGEAKDRLKYSTYTYDEMIRALQYAGFTYEEAKYGADNCGQKW